MIKKLLRATPLLLSLGVIQLVAWALAPRDAKAATPAACDCLSSDHKTWLQLPANAQTCQTC